MASEESSRNGFWKIKINKDLLLKFVQTKHKIRLCNHTGCPNKTVQTSLIQLDIRYTRQLDIRYTRQIDIRYTRQLDIRYTRQLDIRYTRQLVFSIDIRYTRQLVFSIDIRYTNN